jgi:adenylate cyclase
VELSPGFALGHAGLGYALAVGGQPEQGLQSVEQAHRLSRRDPFLANYAPVVRYTALFALKRYEETVAVCRATAASHPKHAGAWRLLAASLGLMGRIDEAREALIHALTLQADLSDDEVYSDPADRARVMEGLRKAGLKG